MSPRLLSGPARLAGSSLLRLQSDERLVALARTGHGPAFAAIVERYREELLRYAERLVGRTRAEDVLQQALLNAHLAMASTDDKLNLRAWLYRITHNVAVNVLRAARPEAVLDASAAAPRGLQDDLEVRERLHAALAAIARLPEPQRDALTLQAIEGRSHEEVAAALGVTTGAARQQVHRARMSLRAAVSAITPYGFLLRIGAPGAASGVSGAEITAGAGAAGGVAKIAATVLAAGALAGGATQLPSATHDATPPAQAREAAAPGRVGASNAPGGPEGATALAGADSPTDDHGDRRGRDDDGTRRHGEDEGERHGGGSDDGFAETGDDHGGSSGSDDDGPSGESHGDDSLSSGPGSGDDDSNSGPSTTSESGSDDFSDDRDGLSSGPGSGDSTPIPVIQDAATTPIDNSGPGGGGSDDGGSSGSGDSSALDGD